MVILCRAARPYAAGGQANESTGRNGNEDSKIRMEVQHCILGQHEENGILGQALFAILGGAGGEGGGDTGRARGQESSFRPPEPEPPSALQQENVLRFLARHGTGCDSRSREAQGVQ